MRNYVKDRGKVLALKAVLWCFLNVYAGFLCIPSLQKKDLIYLNLLILAWEAAMLFFDYSRWKKECEKFRELIRTAKEDQAEISERMGQLLTLADYITKWSHEAKLPLTSLKLMNERNPDNVLRKDMKDCIARLERLIQTVMMGSKLQRPENDVKYERVSLEAAVKESVKNQSYFLMHEQFEISLDTKELSVYSDRRWLVYLLDQLIGNAVKYSDKAPKLIIEAGKEEDGSVVLRVKDNGIGIPDEDLPYVFDKGYVGRNLRKGDYHSTGMGLYFVKKISELLNISVKVFSREGEGCCFVLKFCDIADHFLWCRSLPAV